MSFSNIIYKYCQKELYRHCWKRLHTVISLYYKKKKLQYLIVSLLLCHCCIYIFTLPFLVLNIVCFWQFCAWSFFELRDELEQACSWWYHWSRHSGFRWGIPVRVRWREWDHFWIRSMKNIECQTKVCYSVFRDNKL